jgi:RNA-splicing ligase RtcB
MLELVGKFTNAIIYTDFIESKATEQVIDVLNCRIFENETIRIMPDCHAGKGCVIGFTSTINNNRVIPSLVGVDIGCGISTFNLGELDINLLDLDNFIRNNIPHGNNVNKNYRKLEINSKIKEVCNSIKDDNELYHYNSIGSLGGGNHFIELNKDEDNNVYLNIHSGSRNFGHKIATYYQDLAKDYCKKKRNNFEYIINSHKGMFKVEVDDFITDCNSNKNFYQVSSDLSFLEDSLKDAYIRDMKVAQEFAKINRKTMITKIVNYLKCDVIEEIETVHNYIGDDNIIRKGAVEAYKDQLLVIPINMKDGTLICKGKGNSDWNYSTCHGAGRLMSRSQAKNELSLDDFKEQMKDVYSSCIHAGTLDESPKAYKDMKDIINNIKDTVDIIKVIKPIYNFKG